MRIGGGRSSDDRVNLGWRVDAVVAGRMGWNLMGRIRGLLRRDNGYKRGTVGTGGGCGLFVADLADCSLWSICAGWANWSGCVDLRGP